MVLFYGVELEFCKVSCETRCLQSSTVDLPNDFPQWAHNILLAEFIFAVILRPFPSTFTQSAYISFVHGDQCLTICSSMSVEP